MTSKCGTGCGEKKLGGKIGLEGDGERNKVIARGGGFEATGFVSKTLEILFGIEMLLDGNKTVIEWLKRVTF